jgi:8-oxo-dGTP pyrophosphatase MutT (NUDIX family)
MAQPLPGEAAQRQMAPRPAGARPKQRVPKQDARASSVLILLHHECLADGAANTAVRRGELNLILTLRNREMKAPGGQISLPGGRQEPDETPYETALREASEEIALYADEFAYLGQLSRLYIPVTNNLVHPVVGFMPHLSDIAANPEEVEEIFTVSLDQLLDPDFRQFQRRELGSVPYDIPYWDVHPEVPLWGATAMMLSELVTLYSEYRQAGGDLAC